MKRLIAVLVLLAIVLAGYFLFPVVQADQGYVLFAYKGFRFQSSLWAFLALLVAVVVLYYLVKWVLRAVFGALRIANPWSRRNKARRLRHATEQGLLDLAEGRWSRAQQQLTQVAKAEKQPLVYYLGAARAAHEQARYEQSDQLLEQALHQQPQAELAIALTHAELQQQRGQLPQAVETLEVMHERHGAHPLVLRQLQRLYLEQRSWSQLLGLLPDLRKAKVLNADELDHVERQAWRGRLAELGVAGADSAAQLEALHKAWHVLSAALRHEPELVATYVEQLRLLGEQVEAEQVLREAIKRHYDSCLVRFYGAVRGQDPAKQLQQAESWLKAHPKDASLLLTLGRLCLQNQLWGKALDYFESSLAQERHPETCAELARLLTQMGQLERSNKLLNESFGLLNIGLPALPLPKATGA